MSDLPCNLLSNGIEAGILEVYDGCLIFLVIYLANVLTNQV